MLVDASRVVPMVLSILCVWPATGGCPCSGMLGTVEVSRMLPLVLSLCLTRVGGCQVSTLASMSVLLVTHARLMLDH